jgi:3-deoxy-7-phosphoheptulonate synthase/chorismate mutase
MTAADPARDPLVSELRDRISENDLAILQGINERLQLVQELRQIKAARGFGFVDRGREERILELLAAANRGPLSEEGVREIFAALLELTKRELGER